MRWAVDVACRKYMKDAYKILGGKLKGRDKLQDPGIYPLIILKCILNKQNVRK